VAALMVDNSFHTLPVVEDGRLVGIIGKADILKTLTASPSE
jgi:CBS domain-containing protein